MNNFKYHTVPELEKLTDNLKEEIEFLKKTTEMAHSTSVQARTLQDSIDMLREAEFEIMERTLLK